MVAIESPKALLNASAGQMHLSPTLQINELVRQRLDQGKSVVHLGFGEAQFPLAKEVLKKHQEASEATAYLPVAGLTALRQSIARFQTRRLGVEILPEQVVVAPGSKPLLFAFFDLLEGDVLLPRPSWVSYEPQIKHAGKRVYWVETDPHDRHTITGVYDEETDSLQRDMLSEGAESSLQSSLASARAEGRDPRVMLINSPSNPTGQVFSKANLKIITDFCRDNRITLISDEIYSDICFSDESAASPASLVDFNASQLVLTGGLSKTYSAGGWRVGFAVFPKNAFGEELKVATLAYASECWSAASSPAQEAAAVAFGTTPEMDLYRSQVSNAHAKSTKVLYKALLECGLAVPEPKGAFYLYPSFHPYTAQLHARGITTSVQLSQWLLQECGVAALPGSVFGEVDEGGVDGGRFRLRMATSCLYFRDSQERYERGYQLLEAQEETEQPSESLPLMSEAIAALRAAVEKLGKAV